MEVREMIELLIEIYMRFKWGDYLRRDIMRSSLFLSMKFRSSIEKLLSVKCLFYLICHRMIASSEFIRKNLMIIDWRTSILIFLIWDLASTAETDAAPLWSSYYILVTYRFDFFIAHITSTSKHVEHI